MAKIYHHQLYGLRQDKYQWLLEHDLQTTEWKTLQPTSPFYLFLPQDTELLGEYHEGYKISDIFLVNSVGITTARDSLTIKWSAEEIWETVKHFSSLPTEQAREAYDLGKDAQDWKVHLAQEDINQSKITKQNIVPILYRPFDIRFTYYTGKSSGFIGRPRPDVMHHMLLAGKNMGLCINREVNNDFHHILCTRNIINDCAVSLESRERTYLLPLYLYPDPGKQLGKVEAWPEGPAGRRPNLNPEVVKELEKRLKLKFFPHPSPLPAEAGEGEGEGEDKKPLPAGEGADKSSRPLSTGKGGLFPLPSGEGKGEGTFGPEDIFHYIYAIFHSPTYRSRYAEFLKIDFPRVPLTSDAKLFRSLAANGRALVSLHLLESPALSQSQPNYNIKGNNLVDKGYPKFNQRKVYINKEQYFEGVPEAVWNFYIGGYQVCEKWLKDRRGRKLSYDDIQHYQKIVVALRETIPLMEEIDALIPSWPIK